MWRCAAQVLRPFGGTILAVAAIVLCTGASADKITSDPNAPKPPEPVVEVKEAPKDERLDQKVTYTAVGKRLHHVIDDLSASTGVRIRSGKNEKDWQARDIPVTVIVKDLPLGRVLKSLADATHLDLKTERSATTGQLAYRISQDERLAAELEDYDRKNREIELKALEWSWDAMVRLADMPRSAFQPPVDRPQIASEIPKTLATARLLKALGPQGKKAAFSGESLFLCSKTYKDSQSLNDVFRAVEDTSRWDKTLTQQDLDNCYVEIRIRRDAPPGYSVGETRIALSAEGSSYGTGSQLGLPYWVKDCLKGNKAFETPKELFRRGPMPQSEPTDIKPIWSFPNCSAVNQKRYSSEPVKTRRDGKMVEVPAIWEDPALAATVKLDIKASSTELRTKDVFTAWPKIASFNLVCEDFADHKSYGAHSLKQVVGKETTFGEMLLRLDGFQWFVDTKDLLAMGRSSTWSQDHRNLMPEAVLTTLKEKADTTGVELEDLLVLTRFSSQQRQDWVSGSADLSFLPNLLSAEQFANSVWKLYDALTPQQQAVAKSDSGFSLAGIDAEWLRTFLLDSKEDSDAYMNGRADDMLKRREEAARTRACLADAQVLAGLVLRVTQNSGRYIASLTGTAGGEEITIRASDLWASFPIYSPKRRTELEGKPK